MHLYFISKGIKHEVDQFITELQGKYLPYKYRDSEDKPFQDALLQLSVRPIQLWEVGFPKECYNEVCSTILGTSDQGAQGNDGTKPVRHKFLDKFIFGIKKILHLDSLKPWEFKPMPLRRIGVSTIGLGTKDDYMLPTGCEGL